ncbi:MAG: hypothetical protein KF799_11855 [Bdellovibrionales bacterium]|nr:hypothetical protein [Bdellovibrionales bacterium]
MSFLLLGLIALPASAWAQKSTSASAGPSSTTYSRGTFSFQVGYGYEETKMLNDNNSSAKFTGKGMLANVDLTIWGMGPGEFRLTATGRMMDSKDGQASANTLSSESFSGGLKVFTTSWLYFGGGMGAIHQRIKSTTTGITTTNQFYYAQTGIEIPIFSSFYLGLNGIAHVNPIRKTSPMTGHSYSDGYSAYLMLIYSPPNLSITNVISKR